jgi:hypothetical protein
MNKKQVIAFVFLSALVISAVVSTLFFGLAIARVNVAADGESSNSEGRQLAMPEEYLNYTILVVNGTLWAKIDGVYPMHLTGENGTVLPMGYPTPPNTTNMHIWLDDAELTWSNYSEIDPTARHPTDIGDWEMVYALVAPASPDFVLKIHYEHPVEVINGTYTFLYDLNISPYLSPSSPKSTAHFNFRVETNCSAIDVFTTGFSGMWTSMNYTSAKDGSVETVSFDIVSEHDKPLWGDIVVALVNVQVPEFSAGAVVAIVVAASLAGFMVFKGRARRRTWFSADVWNKL